MGKRRRDRSKVSKETIGRLRERFQGLCEACGKTKVTQAHHIQYRSRGGDSSLDNIANLCQNCHCAVHAGKPGLERFRRHSWEEADPRIATWEEPVIFGRWKKNGQD